MTVSLKLQQKLAAFERTDNNSISNAILASPSSKRYTSSISITSPDSKSNVRPRSVIVSRRSNNALTPKTAVLRSPTVRSGTKKHVSLDEDVEQIKAAPSKSRSCLIKSVKFASKPEFVCIPGGAAATWDKGNEPVWCRSLDDSSCSFGNDDDNDDEDETEECKNANRAALISRLAVVNLNDSASTNQVTTSGNEESLFEPDDSDSSIFVDPLFEEQMRIALEREQKRTQEKEEKKKQQQLATSKSVVTPVTSPRPNVSLSSKTVSTTSPRHEKSTRPNRTSSVLSSPVKNSSETASTKSLSFDKSSRTNPLLSSKLASTASPTKLSTSRSESFCAPTPKQTSIYSSPVKISGSSSSLSTKLAIPASPSKLRACRSESFCKQAPEPATESRSPVKSSLPNYLLSSSKGVSSTSLVKSPTRRSESFLAPAPKLISMSSEPKPAAASPRRFPRKMNSFMGSFSNNSSVSSFDTQFQSPRNKEVKLRVCTTVSPGRSPASISVSMRDRLKAFQN